MLPTASISIFHQQVTSTEISIFFVGPLPVIHIYDDDDDDDNSDNDDEIFLMTIIFDDTTHHPLPWSL